MRLHSTSREAPPASFRDALTRGIAPDGGLYLPVDLPRIDSATLESWRHLSIGDLAARLMRLVLDDEFDAAAVERLSREAFDFPAPTVPIGRGRFVLELFHGPTLAFKDFGARFLARLMGLVLAEEGRQATVLVATSGDTGGAVARGFYAVPGVRVIVLYPAGKVSPFQEAQMATLGRNIIAVRVPGVFDDCQRLVKQAFRDPRLAALGLTSANSINIGRLLPQAVYYVTSWLAAGGSAAHPVIFAVPCGNLGNLTAGVMAQRMGLPVDRFIAALNANDVLARFLASGTYRAERSVATLSSAMDVGNPSNLARLIELHGGSLERLRQNLFVTSVSDGETRAAIRELRQRSGYLIDPHGAVAYVAAERYAEEHPAAGPIVVLATAHPAKFGDIIRRELGVEPELPPAERDWAARPLVTDALPDTRYESFQRLLLADVGSG